MSQKQFTVSVAMCTYNGEKYLKQQLASIIQQTIPPDEIVVCDDGSTDKTVKIVKEYSRQFPSLRLVQNETNLGFTRNFEKAVGLTTGDLVFLSDQDDVWLPNRIEAMSRIFAEQPAVGMVFSNFVFTDSNLQPVTASSERLRAAHLSRVPHKVIQEWGNIAGCTMAFRATLKPFVLPIPPEWSHDAWITLLCRVFSEARRTDEKLMYYRLHTSSSSGNLKYLSPVSRVVTTKIKRTQLKYYTDERIRWSAFYERLLDIQARPSLTLEEREAVSQFLNEARRRSDFARRREDLKKQPRFKRVLPALRLVIRRDYGRYLNGLFTFAKDVFLA
jgi:glycosyltransferase involved in cell wall biosynthesis